MAEFTVKKDTDIWQFDKVFTFDKITMIYDFLF